MTHITTCEYSMHKVIPMSIFSDTNKYNVSKNIKISLIKTFICLHIIINMLDIGDHMIRHCIR